MSITVTAAVRRICAVAVLVAVGSVSGACGSAEDATATAAATAFTNAVAARDGATVCALLTGRARHVCNQVTLGLPGIAGPAPTIEV